MNAVSDFHYTIWTVQIMQDKIIIVETGVSEIFGYRKTFTIKRLFTMQLPDFYYTICTIVQDKIITITFKPGISELVGNPITFIIAMIFTI